MSGRVEIGRTVNYETLERALVGAAEEVGWKAKVKDKFEKGYRLGSVSEVQSYSNTFVHLRGRFLPAMKVCIPNKKPTDDFFIWTGYLHDGFASERRIQDYLSAVFRHLG